MNTHHHPLAALPAHEFWHGKRVLVTGHTGFKGSWLTLWLKKMGAQVCGIALPPDATPALFTQANVALGIIHHECDIRDAGMVADLVGDFQPELVFHLAAQPLVRASYQQPLETFSTNVMGTVHLLNALRNINCVKAAVMVTTDKVYQNREWAYPYREDDALGGHDPYSSSKAAAELVTASYRSSFLAAQGVAVATARAGNVIGGGDWADDRLIPDAVRAWQSGATLTIRRPAATRPWQHVLEPLSGYLVLAQRLWHSPEYAEAWNFGPPPDAAVSVRNVIKLARASFGSGEVEWGNASMGPHEAGNLAVENAKARLRLGVVPRWDLNETVQRTLRWYRRLAEGEAARTLCEEEIADYEA
ncbi:MAG: CDP-glucose 4,6-dehydratase [Burkholderiaceae bacterium]|nr:MAG: CDP-glucose 4,6-dehydratase [Burkholderiaceae bacterium]